jgi:hypothetical protein
MWSAPDAGHGLDRVEPRMVGQRGPPDGRFWPGKLA